ncbi:hypothetical protein O9G_005730, partial [Rozella allomycis CSF55]
MEYIKSLSLDLVNIDVCSALTIFLNKTGPVDIFYQLQRHCAWTIMNLGIGSSSFWGFTPAIDLNIAPSRMSEVHYLIQGGSDLRHVLKTLDSLANDKDHQFESINFYIIEAEIPTITKLLLLMNLILDEEHDMTISERTEVFLEVYGN